MLFFKRCGGIHSLNIGYGTSSPSSVIPDLSPTIVGDKIPQTRARVLYDYEGKDKTELCLVSDEVSMKNISVSCNYFG